MAGKIIGGGILLLLLLLLLCRVGAELTFGEQLTVAVRFGLLRRQVVPAAKKEKKQKKKAPKDKKPAKPAPSIGFSAVAACLPELWRILKKGLRMTRQRVRIDPMRLCITIGGDDPADTALQYGKAEAAMWAVMPQLERLTRLPNPQLHLQPQLENGKTAVRGEIGISLRVWDGLAMAFACGIPLVKCLIRMQKEDKQPDDKRKEAQHGKQENDSQRDDGHRHEQGAGDGQQ